MTEIELKARANFPDEAWERLMKILAEYPSYVFIAWRDNPEDPTKTECETMLNGKGKEALEALAHTTHSIYTGAFDD
jgi:hypothetical protein